MDNIELKLIRLFLNNEDIHSKYFKAVYRSFQSTKSSLLDILSFIDSNYSRTFDEVPFFDVSIDKKEILFFTERVSSKRESNEFFAQIWSKLKQIECNQELVDSIQPLLKAYKTKTLYEDIALVAANAYQSNKGSDEALTELLSSYEELRNLQESTDELFTQDSLTIVDKSLDDLLNEHATDNGLHFRLRCLQQSLGPLRKGDFGFIFARPETGKTTFLASEVSNFIEQVSEETPIVWFNNEEQGDKVYIRLYQALYNLTIDELKKDRERIMKDFDERFRKRLIFVDEASISSRDVMLFLQKITPSIIIFDQIDKIKGFKDDRDDLELGKIYIWARELAKQYCPVIGVCQAGATAQNKQWLDMNDVVNAKTSKQAEADWILGIGATEAAGNQRFFSICKNKLMGGPHTMPEYRKGKLMSLIIPERARYEDI